MDLEYAWFKKKIYETAGLNLDNYRPEQTKRLLGKILDKAGAKNYVEYIKYLKGDPDRIQEFKDNVTINVSSLFRDYDRWMELNKILPDLIRRKASHGTGKTKPGDGEKPILQIWSVGCSIGAEAHTIAILLEETAASGTVMPFSYRILCTDIDHNMLQRGREGIYTDREVKEVPENLLEKYFVEIKPPGRAWANSNTAEHFYKADPRLTAAMRYKIHNLLDDRWESCFDLIVCRNVLIYFTNDVKEHLFDEFFKALLVDGMLFIGGTEIIFSPGKFGLENVSTGIYKKMKSGKVS
jgi:chemotaxis protein methyltransferase CheR